MTKEKAIYVLNNTAWLAPSDDTSVDKAIEIACEALSADVVEVIRCKDCENWDTTWQNDWMKNCHFCPLVDGTRNGDFYCADAERRTDEQIH